MREEIARLQTKIKKLEQSIVQDELKITTLTEFNTFFETCKEFAIEYQTIYKKVEKIQEKKELYSFLEEELSFLQLIVSLLKGLSHYHDVIGCIDNREIMEEWKKMRILVLFQNTESQLKQIEKILKHSKNQNYYQKRRELLESRELALPTVLQAEYDLIGKMATEYNSSEKEKETLNKDDIEINFDFFSSIPVTKKISYLKLLLKNNEKIPGEKESILVNGKEKSISTNCVARYRVYLLLLNSCEIEYQKALTKIVLEEKDYKTIPKEIFSNYLKIYREKESRKNEKKDFEENSEQEEEILKQIEEEYDLTFIKNEEEYASFFEKQETLFNRLYFLENTPNQPRLVKEIKKVKEELRQIQHSLNFTIQIYLHSYLYTEPISADLRYLYVSIIMYIEEFQKSDKYSDVQKESITNAILDLLEKKEFPYFVQAKVENVKQVYFSLPNKKDKKIKIKSKRKPLTKERVERMLIKAGKSIAVILGMASLVGMNYSKCILEQPIIQQNKSFEAKKESEERKTL